MNTSLPSEVRIRKARTSLLLDHPFFGTLLFRLKARPCASVETMATDGISLLYNPAFVDTLTSGELIGTLAHEVMHPALQHHTRRGGRDPRRWNMACDLAVNPLLLTAGLTLPKGALQDNRFLGMSAEYIYNHLPPHEEEQEEQNGTADTGQKGQPSGKKKGDVNAPVTPGGIGQVLDAPDPDGQGQDHEADGPAPDPARDWELAVEQAAAVAKLAGKMPAGATRTVGAARAAKVDWRELLRRAWSETIPSDYCWMPPNRRHVWAGLYLPGIAREGTGEVAIAVDCSGSVNARQLALFEAEIRSILAGQQPSRVYVLYFDAKVHRADTYTAGQPITLTPVGGGGTSFRPCFDWLEQHGIVPQTLVFLTDLEGRFPDAAPPYPVVWATTEPGHAPFGQVVLMDAA